MAVCRRWVYYVRDFRVVSVFRGSTAHGYAWGYLCAASTIIVAPVVLLFLLTQRTFIEGIALTGIKG